MTIIRSTVAKLGLKRGGGSDGKASACSAADLVPSLGRKDPLEKAMAPHCRIAWKITWTEEPDRLQSMGRKESDMIERLQFLYFFHFLFLSKMGY